MTQMIDWMQQRGVPRCDWWPGYDSTRILRAGDDIDGIVEYRWQVIEEFGFPIVTDALVDSLAIIGREMPILDAGCGTGYLAWELKQRGVTVLPVDPEPFTFINATPKRQWLEPVRLPAQQVAVQHPDHALLLSWPSLKRPWPLETLQAYTQAGGQCLILIGEGRGGCCADDTFYDWLHSGDSPWQDVVEVPMENWVGIHDHCLIYRRTPAAIATSPDARSAS